MTTSSFRFGILAPVLALSLMSTFTLHAQQIRQKDLARITIEEISWSAEGNLAMCVRIHAPATRDVYLFSGSPDMNSTHYSVFSMASSYLVDAYTGKKIEALGEPPEKPFYGPLSKSTSISHGGWAELGVAFPAPPPPPPARDGTPQPYKLTLVVPLDVAPVAVNPPPKQ